ncbi:hypothetical protein SAMN05192549_113121 [Duganella sacchari]|uniref:Uncharacterized protein n=1 Tax=Duganella sacchari TaxID=551987 RepID=A0A1M7R6V6_9BURK|nr:hypothetical protein [Duganella sacchari]SHN42037.1 hypothetical protein SAMN05192549_113121 [Duganella sacchari]
MSKPTQGGKNGGNSKLQETKAGTPSTAKGNKQSAASSGNKGSATSGASKAESGSKSR